MAQTAIPVSTKHTSLSSLETVAPPVATESLSISTLASVALPVATSHPSLSLPVPAPLTMAAENRTRLSFVLGSASQNPAAAALRFHVIIIGRCEDALSNYNWTKARPMRHLVPILLLRA